MILNKENREEIIERLDIARRNKGYTFDKLSSVVGLSSGGLRNAFYRKSLNEHKINLLVKELLINEHWLITGSKDCDMFWGGNEDSNAVNEPTPLYGIKEKQDLGVPYFDGFDALINFKTEKPNYYVNDPIYVGCDAVIPAFGNSMMPIIYSGDKIGIKEVLVSDILYGEIYAVYTENWRTIKHIRKSKDENKITLIPENLNDFDIQDVEKSKVQKLYLIKAFGRGVC